MYLPNDPLRAQIDEIFISAVDLSTDQRDRFYVDALGQLPGLVVLRAGNMLLDERFNTCVHYALAECLGQDWICVGQLPPPDLGYHTHDFLTKRGFEEAGRLGNGLLVVYGTKGMPGYLGKDPALHFGVADSENEVRSKFGAGPVVRHPLSGVPTRYGKTARFYRPPEANFN